ncbi:uncharacterized protein LOC129915195 [Episyrphus balteatus]|uniref:uncharacterized protein LOC129915195 n=1 Tax=Episyrphus balteatus TaxID=286459 RepID=UPI002486C7F7|nr:uncharacterized protein LOC129915195 [Episyrphus balteatus]
MSDYREESEAVKADIILFIQYRFIANAKNIHLAEENALLRYKLIRQTNEQLAKSQGNVDSQMKLFSLEEERDKMYENLERLKAKYNKLHMAFLEKAKRCKTLEEVFARQKMLPGLVKKSTLDPTRNNDVIDNSRDQQLQDENIMNSNKIATLQRSLDEAFDIIDELEFELESVDFLEMENERLKNELSKLKKKDANTTTTYTTTMAMTTTTNDDDQRNEDHRLGYEKSSTCSTECEVPASDDLPDLESIERSIQTQSLIDTVQAESHLLRRELLRSRLQNTPRPPLPPRPPQHTTSGLRESSQTQKEANSSEE